MRLRNLALLAVGAVAVAACGRLPADAAAAVGDTVITERTLEVLVRAQSADPTQPLAQPGPEQFSGVADLQRQVLTQLIEDAVVAVAATELGIEIDPEQVEEQFQQLAGQFGGEEGLRREIRARGRTEEDVRAQLAAVVRGDLLSSFFQEQVEVSESEVRAAYERDLDTLYRVADAAHILVGDEALAEDIAAQVRRGADFAELAAQHSIDEFSRASGGALGENPRGRFVEEFDDAVWNAEPGEIVGPVQTQFGWHVIRVDDFRTVPFSDVEDAIRDQLTTEQGQGAFDEWFEQALREADVRVDGRLGSWDPELGQVVPPDPVGADRPTPASTVAPTSSPTGPPTP